MKVAALIAGAGKSERMGRHKALLTLDGESFVSRIVGAFKNAGVQQIFVTVPESQNVAQQIVSVVKREAIFLKNAFSHRQLLGSVQSVLRHSHFSASALLVSPVDAPFVSEALVTKIKEAFLHDPQIVFCAAHGRQLGHPILLPRSTFSQIEALSDHESLRDLSSAIRLVDWHDPRITLNINTPEDYARLTNPSPRNRDAAATDAPVVKFL